MKWYTAQDTFNGDLPTGATVTVVRGETLPETHDLVKLHGEGKLFKLVDPGEETKPASKPAGRRAAS